MSPFCKSHKNLNAKHALFINIVGNLLFQSCKNMLVTTRRDTHAFYLT